MRLTMARILILGSHPDSLVNFRKEMLRDLAAHNHVIACVPDASLGMIHELDLIGVEYRNVRLARTGLNPIHDLKLFKELYTLFKHLQADQLFSYTAKPVIFGSLAAKLAGVKQCYAMITGLGSYFTFSDFKSLIVRSIMVVLYKTALRFNNKVFFQNPDDINDFRRFRIFNDPRRTVMVNGSGVNLDYFKALPTNLEPIKFLLVARLIKSKGINEYLIAAHQLKQQYPHVEFLLVGGGDAKSETIDPQLIKNAVDDKTITYLGKLADVRSALSQASVFVLPSYREGTPRSVLEAMASARPIITTDVPGCRETVIEGENGFLIPAKDVEALRLAMEKFILKPKLIRHMGARSRELAQEKYDVKKVNKLILNSMGHDYV
jgi:glycosyltransferase involved in cell wall biosynthesis